MATCDVVVPTYNNATTLPDAIAALFSQDFPSNWSPQLIISDDGSTDDTLDIAHHAGTPRRWRSTKVVLGDHTGPAGARNRGLKLSHADLVLFLGADIILRPGALTAHFTFHQLQPAPTAAALGMIKWDPRIKPTPFMEWMMHGGGQNNYDALMGSTTANPRHFLYGSHVSLKKAALGANPFTTDYQAYGWEDLDLGRKLADNNLALYVLHDAIGLHSHIYSPRDIYRRQYQAGQNLVIYQRRYPDVTLIPPRTRRHSFKHALATHSGLLPALRWLLTHTASRWSTPYLFNVITSAQLWRGIQARKDS